MSDICETCAAVGSAIQRVRHGAERSTQRELADALGIARPLLSMRESGKICFRWCEIVDVARILGCGVEVLAPETAPRPVDAERVRVAWAEALAVLARAGISVKHPVP